MWGTDSKEGLRAGGNREIRDTFKKESHSRRNKVLKGHFSYARFDMLAGYLGRCPSTARSVGLGLKWKMIHIWLIAKAIRWANIEEEQRGKSHGKNGKYSRLNNRIATKFRRIIKIHLLTYSYTFLYSSQQSYDILSSFHIWLSFGKLIWSMSFNQ